MCILKEIVDFNADIEFEDKASKIKASSTSVQLVTCKQTGEMAISAEQHFQTTPNLNKAVLNIHLENCLENISHLSKNTLQTKLIKYIFNFGRNLEFP